MTEQTIEIFFPMSEETKKIRITKCSYVLSALRGPDDNGIISKGYGAAIVRNSVKGWRYGYVCNVSGLFARLHHLFKPGTEDINLAESVLESIKNAKHHYSNHVAHAFQCLSQLADFNHLAEDRKFFMLLKNVWMWGNMKDLKALYEFVGRKCKNYSFPFSESTEKLKNIFQYANTPQIIKKSPKSPIHRHPYLDNL